MATLKEHLESIREQASEALQNLDRAVVLPDKKYECMDDVALLVEDIARDADRAAKLILEMADKDFDEARADLSQALKKKKED